MDLMYPVCCGLDVHKKQVTACLRRASGKRDVRLEVREFPTTVAGLSDLAVWLSDNDCLVAAMESTGVYWKPVYHVIAESLQEVIVGNAHDMRPPPGKKTDKADAKWIAELLAHGLVRPSFIPPPKIRALRDLTRLRVKYIDMRTQAKNRVHRLLEDCNIKLSSVATDIFGKSGRAILAALIQGERDPAVLADLALGLLRRKIPQLELALQGQFTEHHSMLIQQSLAQVDLFDSQLAQMDARIDALLADHQEEVEQLASIPGMKDKSAATVIAEIGTDMSRFGQDSRLASWAGICPGNDESAGKRRSGKIRKGNKWLKRILTQCAWAARKTDTHLGRVFLRLEKRIGRQKAAIAVGHKILVISYHLLNDGTFYEEERYDQLSTKEQQRRQKAAVRTLEILGYDVQLVQTAT